MSSGDCFDCYRLAPGTCDAHHVEPKRINCYGCGDPCWDTEATKVNGKWLCDDYCAGRSTEELAELRARHLQWDADFVQDTPSLADHPMYRHMQGGDY